MKQLRKILTTLGIAVVVLVVAAGGFATYTVRRSFPQTGGSLKLAGLQAPVEVFRDAYGVPHIYAGSVTDLFMAQGYVHAQDRFYQMDFWRHQTSGRLAELYGDGLVGTDNPIAVADALIVDQFDARAEAYFAERLRGGI